MLLFETPLHLVSETGNVGVVEILVQNGANINETDVKYLWRKIRLID
jgi:hypothetical protein